MAGLRQPKETDQDGDAPIESPQTSHKTQLGTERGTDQARRLETDSKRNLYVTQGSATGIVSALSQGSVSSVPSGTLTVIASFTATGALAITKISCSGSDYGQFRLILDSIVIDIRRTGPSRNTDFLFDHPLQVADTQTIEVKVIHQDGSVSPDFDATIYGV